jgi:hypothetical protein
MKDYKVMDYFNAVKRFDKRFSKGDIFTINELIEVTGFCRPSAMKMIESLISDKVIEFKGYRKNTKLFEII